MEMSGAGSEQIYVEEKDEEFFAEDENVVVKKADNFYEWINNIICECWWMANILNKSK